jgi:hypothetical protein
MAWNEGLFRVLAFTTGIGILEATSHNLIVDGPGYGSPRATIYITITVAIAVAAMGVGYALARSWTLKALGLICGIVAFKAADLVITAERVIADREALQGPVRAIEDRRADLTARIAQLTNELRGLKTSERLAAASLRRRDRLIALFGTPVGVVAQRSAHTDLAVC